MFLLLLIEPFARSSLASRVSYFGRTHGTASMGCFKRGLPPLSRCCGSRRYQRPQTCIVGSVLIC